jgi:hypothetical protein
MKKSTKQLRYSITQQQEHLASLRKCKDVLSAYLGVKLRETSFIRNSSSHSRSVALDVAPSYENVMPHYALIKGRDPLLLNRPELIQRTFNSLRDVPFGFLIAIENDHFHIQLMKSVVQPSMIMRFPSDRAHLYSHDHQDMMCGRINLFTSTNQGPQPYNTVNESFPPFTGIMASGVTMNYEATMALLM